MTKFKAVDCKNFEGQDVSVIEEQKVIHICTTPYCVDSDKCTREIVEIIPDVHFEPKTIKLD